MIPFLAFLGCLIFMWYMGFVVSKIAGESWEDKRKKENSILISEAEVMGFVRIERREQHEIRRKEYIERRYKEKMHKDKINKAFNKIGLDYEDIEYLIKIAKE